MNKKDNPVNVPSMKIDRDDVRASQPKNRSTAVNPKRPEAMRAEPVKTSKDWLAFAVAVAALIGSSVLGYLYYQQSQVVFALEARMTQSNMDLTDAKVQLNTLLEDAEEAHDFANSEIRKLWGVAYDRNRSAIASNTTAIARLESSLASTTDRVTAAARTAGESGSAIERLQSELASKEILVSEANQRALLLGEIIEEQQLQLQNMADTISQLERANAISEAELKERIDATEEMMEGFNAYRQSVNRQLNELRSQLAAPAGQ